MTQLQLLFSICTLSVLKLLYTQVNNNSLCWNKVNFPLILNCLENISFLEATISTSFFVTISLAFNDLFKM